MAFPLWTRLVLLMAALGLGGCSSSCLASDPKLARLVPGMTYEEVSAVMGCEGRLMRGSPEADDGFMSAEWTGPRSLLRQTDMLFRDRRLVWFDTRPSPGF
jgi:hypothetical protein